MSNAFIAYQFLSLLSKRAKILISMQELRQSSPQGFPNIALLSGGFLRSSSQRDACVCSDSTRHGLHHCSENTPHRSDCARADNRCPGARRLRDGRQVYCSVQCAHDPRLVPGDEIHIVACGTAVRKCGRGMWKFSSALVKICTAAGHE